MTADFESPGYIFFLRAKHIMGHFRGFFEGALTFLTPKCPSLRYDRTRPLRKSQEMPLYMFYRRQKKKILQDFQNQRYIGIFMSLRVREREREQEKERERVSKKEKGKGKGKGKEREITKMREIYFLNRLGRNENFAKY
jgi:hypothetical protein